MEISRHNLAFIRQLFATISAAWTPVSHGLLSGYTTQAIPSLLRPDSEFNLSEEVISWMSCIVPLAAVLGGPFSSPLCYLIGRRGTMMVASVILSIGWILITFAQNAAMILVGRSITGLASAISLPAAYTYVTEISSSERRGFLGSVLSIGWCFGLVMSYSLGSVLHWNWLALASTLVPVVQFCALFKNASSPRWLTSRGKLQEARNSLAYFRGGWNKSVDCECKDMEMQVSVNEGNASILGKYKAIWSKSVRKAVLLCMTTYFFTMMTGFIIVNFHAKVILLNAKVTMNANMGVIILGSCGLVGNIFSSLVIDRLGRKTLLLISSCLVLIAQIGLGTYLYLDKLHMLETSHRWIPMALLILFVVSFPIGWGSVTYILVSELVPTFVRTETAILCSSWEQLLSFGVLKIHAAMCSTYGAYTLHWASGGFMACSLVFVYFFLPETSQKSLEEIETFFTHLQRDAVGMIGKKTDCSEFKGRKISLCSLTDYLEKNMNKIGMSEEKQKAIP